MAYSIFLLLAFAKVVLTQSTVPAVDCPGRELNPLFADKEDCNKYWKCIKNGKYYTTTGKKCPKKQMFNELTSSCHKGPCIRKGPNMENLPCQELGSNKFLCKQNGCEFSLVDNYCLDEMGDCECEMFSKHHNCRRGDAIYSNGGVFCMNKPDMVENCSISEVVHATNLNGDAYILPFSSGRVPYRRDDQNSVTDPEKTARYGDLSSDVCASETEESFKKLFATVVYPIREGCITYPVPLKGDGAYELTILTAVADDAPHVRGFDVKINLVTVLHGIDPFLLLPQKCGRLQLIILLTVDGGGTRILPTGFTTPIPVALNKMELSFCTGSPQYINPAFQVSAFSLVKFKDPLHCKAHGSNATACRLDGCQFDNKCIQCVMPRKEECGEDELILEEGLCRRSNYFYITGNGTCRSPAADTSDSCSSADLTVIYSLNANGPSPVTYKDITYLPHSNPYDDPNGIIEENDWSEDVCPHLKYDEVFTKLHGPHYSSSGWYYHYKKKGCVSFPSRLNGDGRYELIMLIPILDDAPFYRSFDIKINSVMLLLGVDPFHLLPQKCGMLELVVPFKVHDDNTKLTPLGSSSPIRLSKNGFDLQMCTGTMNYPLRDFLLSGFAVTGVISDEHCFAHSNQRNCLKDDCQWNAAEDRCVGGIKECFDAGFFDGFGECRRGNAYYNSARVLCHNLVDVKEPCRNIKVVRAVNVGSPRIGFKMRGIPYLKDLPGEYHLKDSRRVEYDARKDCFVKDDTNQNIWFYLKGIRPRYRNDCLIYYVPVTEDGKYELSILSVVLEEKEKQSALEVIIDETVILLNTDTFALGMEKCAKVEIVQLMTVQNGGKELLLLGWPKPQPIQNGKFALGFCTGYNNYPNYKFYISGYSFVKLNDV